MAKIHIIGSSSKGNGYVIETKNERLLLECGCKWEKMLKACRFKLSTIKGCLVSHKHQDHAKHIGEYLCKGFPVLAHRKVFVDLAMSSMTYAKAVDAGHYYQLGGFKILPITAYHDEDAPTYAYLVEHEEFGKLVFATDTYKFPYKIENVNVWMIEANYDDEIVEENLANGKLSPSRWYRLMLTHMEIEQTTKVLRRNKVGKDATVILIHLSDDNSNAAKFANRVLEETEVVPYIADAGMTIDL